MPRHLVEVTHGFGSLRRGQRFDLDTDDPAYQFASKLLGRYLRLVETVTEPPTVGRVAATGQAKAPRKVRVSDGTGGDRPAGDAEVLPTVVEGTH